MRFNNKIINMIEQKQSKSNRESINMKDNKEREIHMRSLILGIITFHNFPELTV